MNTVTFGAAAVLNTLWQSAALATLVFVAARRLNAATRHVIWWIALAAIVALPFLPRRVSPPTSIATRTQTATSLPVRVRAPLAPPARPEPFTVTQTRTARWTWWILAAWIAVFALRAAGLLRSYLHLRRWKFRAIVWNRPLPALRRRARILLDSHISSPVAVGFLRPAVILPEDLRAQLTPAELDFVLLHESAHLARYDDWTILAARILGAALVVHPVAWWILRQIDRQREMACDDWVVAHTGAACSYAESLARIVELRIRPAESALAAGIFTRHSRLFERIESLLRRGRQFSPAAARKPAIAAAILAAVLASAGALAPHWIAFAQRLEFEVASVKAHPDINGQFEFVPKHSGDRVSVHNIHLFGIITYAYRIKGYQLFGYPQNDYTWYDIEAKIGRDATEDEVRLMFQSLLEDRFKFKVHRETRDLPEFQLSLARAKPKLTPAVPDDLMKFEIDGQQRTWPKGRCGNTLWRDGNRIICHAVTIDEIVAAIGGELGAPVADQTGLTGTYDLNLLFLSENAKPRPDDPPGPSLNDALQRELGLKLEKGKGPVEVLVIDHLEKPTAN